MEENVQQLFEKGKLLARAMENPNLQKDFYTNEFSYDFSVWANEYEIAKQEGLGSLSTTLLVPDEKIPTYKAIGFLINSEKVDIRHVSEVDSGSCGNEKDGTFHANETNIHSLDELYATIKSKHPKDMNEVNVNMREDAYVGLFANNSQVQLPKILLAQKYYELQTGIRLPIFIYDRETGKIDELNIPLEEKSNIVQTALENKKIRSTGIFYETEAGEYKRTDYLEEIKKEIEDRDSVLKSGIDVIAKSTRISSINSQIKTIKMLCKNKENDNLKTEDFEK